MPRDATLSHLASLYAGSPDPWGHLTRPYERAKHAATVEVVAPRSSDAVLEIGCGNGALSARLAPLCRRLVAVEAIPAALAEARRRLTGQDHVTLVEGIAPGDLPEVRPDRIVLSEVLYFLEPGDIDALADWIDRRAAPGCRLVAVNWTGPTGEALTGPQAADRLRAALPAWRGPRRSEEGYILDVLTPVS